MITITNRQYEILTQINYDGSVGLVVLEDEFAQPEGSLLSTYNFSFYRSTADAQYVTVGCFAFAQDGDELRCFEIMETQDEDDKRTVYCVDAGVDLVNEEKGPIDEQESHPIRHYLHSILFDSGWSIGSIHIPGSRTRKLKYEGAESSVKRLKRVADEFDAEVQFNYVIDGDTIVKRVVDVYSKGHLNQGHIVLEYGYEVSSITKTENIYNLATALYGYGEDGINLAGYKVPTEDEADWSIINGVLIHKPSTRKWSRHSDDINGYILAHYESTAKTVDRLYQETKNQLEKRNVPEVTFDIQIAQLPEKVRRGYKVAIIAHDYNPSITIEATVSAVEGVSFADSTIGIAKISNAEQLNIPPLEQEIELLKNRFNSQVSSWNNIPYVLEIKTSNGTIFQNNNLSTTLTAKVTKNNIDVTTTITRFEWTRVSRYNTAKDNEFSKSDKSISITNNDVDLEARFICKAYIDDNEIAQSDIVIKDFVMTTYKGVEPPENADTGTLWVDTSSEPNITKIYDQGKWVNVATEISEEDIANGIENHLAPIREKQQLLEAELQAKATIASGDAVLAEFRQLVESVNTNRDVDAERLFSLMQRLALQETNFGKFKNQWNFLDSFITFSDEGMNIGSKDSSTSILVANGGITIFSNGNEVASFKEGYMKIDNGIFTRSVQVGTKWRIQPYRLNDDILAFMYLGVIEVG